MKILHVITGLTTGGAERMLVKFIEETKDIIDHTVISLIDKGTQGDYLNNIGVKVIEIGAQKSILFPLFILRYLVAVKNINPDIIQGWMYHGNIFAVCAGTIINKSQVVFNIRHSMHGIKKEKNLTRWTIKLNGILSRFAGAIIYNSHTSKLQHQEIGFKPQKALVIPNGFNEKVYIKNNLLIKNLRQELNISENKFIFGKVGRNHPMKNHIGFLKSAVKVIEKYENVHFIIVGRDIPTDAQLQSFIVEESLEHYVTLLGERNDMNRLMNILDCLVVNSSWGEAFPNVIGEAMLCQKPCIVTDVGDSKRIIEDTGISIAADDVEALSDAMLNFVYMEEGELAVLGIKARKIITEKYSIEKIARTYVNLYFSLLEKGQ